MHASDRAVQTSATPLSSVEAIDWVRRNAISLAAVALIAVELWWKANLLSHFYFRQDDFRYFDDALASHFSLSYLLRIYVGHFMPGGFAVTWVLARLSLYDWTLVSIVNLILLAAASLAAFRLLRALFGNRLAILGLLAVYLFTPLTLPPLSFWSTTLNWLPLQLAIFMAAAAHLAYVRTARFWHAIVATAWLAFGMLFTDQGVVVPFILFAMTSAFFISGSWPSAAREALRKYVWAWVVYGALAAAYLAVFFVQLRSSTQQPGRPGAFSGVTTFAWTLLRVSFIPAALGGPWHWYASGPYGFALEVPVLTQLSWVVAGLIVLASLWYRRHAWRAWIILLGWLAVADMLPVILARVVALSPVLLGMDFHYLADSVPVLVICGGLAFLPVVGTQEDAYRAPLPPRLPRMAAGGVLTCCFLAGSFWSGVTYRQDTSAAAANISSYVATARAAIKQATAQLPGGAVIVTAPLPQNVMDPALLGSSAWTARLIGPLIPHGSRLTFAGQQPTTARPLLMFDSLGRLLPVVELGTATRPPAGHLCWRVSLDLTVRLPVYTPYDWIWDAEVAYSGPATVLQFGFDGGTRSVAVPAGSHQVHFAASGVGKVASLTNLGPAASGCVSSVTMGTLTPSSTAYPMPFFPVR
jgi:hypothetical protein